MIHSIMKRVFSLPAFSNKTEQAHFSALSLGALLTISGGWFAQIAIFSSILLMTGKKASIAIYFGCVYIPRLIAPYAWKVISQKLSLRTILIASQFLGGFFASLFIVAIVTNNIVILWDW